MSGSPVVMFLSTGRCGTQWLTTGLRQLHRAVAAVHEPIGPLYSPRRYFRAYDEPEAILEVPEVAAHVDRIESESRPYVETGWPLFPVLPLLAERIPDRLRIVHLTRHPVPSALSHLARSSFAGSRRSDAYTRLATLGPEDPGVFQTHYAPSWDVLTPYEKCLFWWTEVHLFGLELPGRISGKIPVLRVRAEELLAGDRDTLAELLEFMGLSWSEAWCEHAARLVDRWQYPIDRTVDPLEIHRHPTATELAAELGYEISALNVGELEARYKGTPGPALDRIESP